MDQTIEPSGSTLSAMAAEKISAAIIRGDLPPGSRLAIRQLSAELDIGPTPIREGLTGLAGRGLVIAFGQRGFRVADVSRHDLQDLIMARTAIETAALRQAIAKGDADWEGAVAAALQRLKHFSSYPPKTLEERVSDFERLNLGFHTALISGCNSSRLIALTEDLHRQAQRYRNLMLRMRDISPNAYDEHRELAELALGRDADRACSRLAEHNRITMKLIYGDPEV
jgi:DNA-binding GntR family transcriptional regulator